jgi:tetrahydromethanopterin S-methyltransferase subunit C
MPASIILVCLWVVAACVAGMAPQRYHWPAAWVLIGTGIPLLGLVTLTMGPAWGLIALAAGASILRWPILRAGQRLAGLLAPQDREHPGE